jgi:hypothetical protein
VPHGVQGGYDDVRRGHLVRLHLHLRHLGRPRHPLAADGNLRAFFYNGVFTQSGILVTYRTARHTKIGPILILSCNKFILCGTNSLHTKCLTM